MIIIFINKYYKKYNYISLLKYIFISKILKKNIIKTCKVHFIKKQRFFYCIQKHIFIYQYINNNDNILNC